MYISQSSMLYFVEPHFTLLSLGCHVSVAMAGAGHPDEAYEWGRGLPTAARGRHPTAHHRRDRWGSAHSYTTAHMSLQASIMHSHICRGLALGTHVVPKVYAAPSVKTRCQSACGRGWGCLLSFVNASFRPRLEVKRCRTCHCHLPGNCSITEMDSYIASGFQAVVPKPFSHTHIRMVLRFLCKPHT